MTWILPGFQQIMKGKSSHFASLQAKRKKNPKKLKRTSVRWRLSTFGKTQGRKRTPVRFVIFLNNPLRLHF
jgi:hypothetical protein